MLINFQNDVLPFSIIQMWTNYAQEMTIWNNIIKVQRKNCTQCNCAEICYCISAFAIVYNMLNKADNYKHFEEARFK